MRAGKTVPAIIFPARCLPSVTDYEIRNYQYEQHRGSGNKSIDSKVVSKCNNYESMNYKHSQGIESYCQPFSKSGSTSV
jgi:hypothetical protein